ncbi:MAG: hypothetical protein LBU27_03160 [Candidatus Peribacteria bacterium]|jgi:hypothetical protein|nr:hypothetical protein [Candidatus Peribacteria bacterium]
MWKLNEEEGNLNEKREEITALATELFQKITSFPYNVGRYEEETTGIVVFCRVYNSNNLITISVGNPSEQTQSFAIEKAVRMVTKNDYRLAMTPDVNFYTFSGVTYFPKCSIFGYTLRCGLVCSVLGLELFENATISSILASRLLEIPVKKIISSWPELFRDVFSEVMDDLEALVKEYGKK